MKAIIMETWHWDVVNDIIDLAEEFIIETKFPVTFNRDLVYDRLHTAFFSDDGDIILVMADDGKVAGGAVVYACADYQEEKFGYIEKFFVRSQCRAQGVGRILAEKTAVWFDDNECLFSFATSTANIGATRLFENLMSKYGYRNLGPTLMRKLDNANPHA